ncbi:GNAT family N-acetyltransferase [Paracoccus aerodenitrificans]|uniref:GNAT family N-acetyltransferase n=1 Tax=Paracoccus aerodenitrificans TaxID=3017781 RepID=UPI0022F0170D|nr:GNAT family N-acetyltransferase [Paracoccus aerodenitrificans]WBU65210.1 GNAT family N-acetyltransferase [Paracoccus aerodenitrificans]
MTAPILHTDRLTLRLPEAGDHAAYSAFFADADASAFYGGPLLPYQAYGILCRDIGHWSLKGFGKFVIEAKGEALGGCGIVHPEGWPGHELTWWLLPSARGQGIAQEASRAVLGFARDSLGWSHVETHFRDENIPARRLTESLGGTKQRRETFPDGIKRDIYAIPTPAKDAQ